MKDSALNHRSPVRVSAVVCTRNRAVALQRGLASFLGLKLNGAVFELVVVDNGSADETASVIIGFAAQAPFPVRLVIEPEPGLSRARNRGLRHAAGDLILMTDDDCYVEPEWVQAALARFESGLRQIVGGRLELFNPAHLRVTFKTSTSGETLAEPGKIFGFLHGANMAFGRPVVEEIGPFDVRFGAGTALRAAEDTEFVYRGLKAGIPIIYDPSMAISHDHGRTGLDAQVRLERGYAIGIGGLVGKALVSGKADLVKPVYWTLRSAFQAWRSGTGPWWQVAIKCGLAVGLMRFLLFDIWRRAS